MSKKENPFKYKIPTGYVACGGQLRIYPNQQAFAYFMQTFGNCRYVWNQFKDCFDTRYQNNSKLQFPKLKYLYQILTQLKREHDFLKKSDSTALQIVVANYSQAQWDYMKSKHGKPHFKSRRFYKQTFNMKSNCNSIRIIGSNLIRLPKIGLVRCSNTACFNNYKILRATITWREDLNKFWISFNGIKPQPKHYHKTNKIVGIDIGLGNEWLVTSDGHRFNVPAVKELQHQRDHWQSIKDKRKNVVEQLVVQFNNTHKDCTIDAYNYHNWQKARKTMAKYNFKITNIRIDRIRKAVKWLVTNYDVIVIEDLKVKNLMHNHKLARAIANACWYKFRQILEYECNWYGKKLVIVPPQYTSRICSNCQRKNPEFQHLKTNQWLAIRQWTCPFCYTNHNRDINAAINIKNRGLKILKQTEGWTRSSR